MAKKIIIVVDGDSATHSGGALTVFKTGQANRTFDVAEAEYDEFTADHADMLATIISGFFAKVIAYMAAGESGLPDLNPLDGLRKLLKMLIK